VSKKKIKKSAADTLSDQQVNKARAAMAAMVEARMAQSLIKPDLPQFMDVHTEAHLYGEGVMALARITNTVGGPVNRDAVEGGYLDQSDCELLALRIEPLTHPQAIELWNKYGGDAWSVWVLYAGPDGQFPYPLWIPVVLGKPADDGARPELKPDEEEPPEGLIDLDS